MDLEELGDRFPVISNGIKAEMKLIKAEQDLRARGKSTPTPPEAPEPAFEWDDFETLALLEDTCIREDDLCEN